jgi:uncharacterized protein YqeY
VPLSDQLTLDLKDAMRAGDVRRRDVIRYLRSAIKNAEIERRRGLTDDEIQDVIRHQIKQRRDSIALFRKGGRDDLAEEEEAQISLLLPYLPTQLSEAELKELVVRVAEDVRASSPRDMGKLMQALVREAGGRAEGAVLSALAREELARRASGGPR